MHMTELRFCESSPIYTKIKLLKQNQAVLKRNLPKFPIQLTEGDGITGLQDP